MRDIGLEMDLQSRLDDGRSVWAVGDVHGHFTTLEALVGRLNLGEGDAIVMLGDLIDRGPKSAHVVRYVRGTERVFSIRGNHEQMMIEGFDESSFFKERSVESRVWYHNGGMAT